MGLLFQLHTYSSRTCALLSFVTEITEAFFLLLPPLALRAAHNSLQNEHGGSQEKEPLFQRDLAEH